MERKEGDGVRHRRKDSGVGVAEGAGTVSADGVGFYLLFLWLTRLTV